MNKINIYLHNYNTRKKTILVKSIIIIQKYSRQLSYKKKLSNLLICSNCAICLENIYYDNKCVFLENCPHVFHKNCINTWMRLSTKTCPICRTTISNSNQNNLFSFCDLMNKLFYMFIIYYILYSINQYNQYNIK
jgi:hypothetical protein